ncbi:hypothetical protein E2C01_034316 [Portunus trituberculatus]|uniref:Uncharacterized protein n=1 Tax=Portunus trituberculatus TaxID=210409 RepID=A0A5B7F0D1_PORTR|nr:hypothetical protein [Portunus trituberculatus]
MASGPIWVWHRVRCGTWLGPWPRAGCACRPATARPPPRLRKEERHKRLQRVLRFSSPSQSSFVSIDYKSHLASPSHLHALVWCLTSDVEGRGELVVLQISANTTIDLRIIVPSYIAKMLRSDGR